jgi:Tol biopolymer transport system component
MNSTVMESTLEVMEFASGQRTAVYRTNDHIEAPNWSRDGSYFLFNSAGLLYRLPRAGGTPVKIDTGPLSKLNNDHGYSPDGKRIAISDKSDPDGKSRVSILPAEGGVPQLITAEGPSYWHGWSPDGKTLVYVAARGGSRILNLYAAPADGGPETRLTESNGLDDGPDYSPDGRFIYFNSVRSGNMKIWRMRSDGSDPEQLTFEPDTRDWFPHPSPDGRWIVFISFGTDVEASAHPANKNVTLRVMRTSGGSPRDIARLLGGQGTLNVPSWSPDGRRFAFVSYRAT